VQIVKLAAVLVPLALTVAGCVTATEEQSKASLDAFWEEARIARLEKYGECPHDRWKSISVIGKTKSADAVRVMRACDMQFDFSRHVSASHTHGFLHLGHRMWHFVDGTLVSYVQ